MRKTIRYVSAAFFLILLLTSTALASHSPGNFPPVRTMVDDTFSDVESGHWFCSGVKISYERGMMDGVGDGRFAPGDTVPWSQAVTIACRILSASRGEEIPAVDGTWYAQYASYGKKAGILPADAPPEENWSLTPIDRQSLAYLFHAVTAADSLPAICDPAIPDLDLVGKQKQAAVKSLYAAGIFTGRTDGSFDPTGLTTRGELATMLSRLLCPIYRVAPTQAGLYRFVPEGVHHRFINHVDGYSLVMEGDPAVDMTYSGVATVLEREDLRVEIYKQDLSQCGRTNYLIYSNGFLSNEEDHHSDYMGYQRIGNWDVYVTVWHRDALSRVANDKNYYMTLDILSDNYSYSLFFKSTHSEGLWEEGLRLAESFRLEDVTAAPYTRIANAADVENRGWNQETADFYQQHFGEDASLTWGIYEPAAAYEDFSALQTYETHFDYTFPVLLGYSDFQSSRSPRLFQRLTAAWNRGSVMELTLQTTPTEDGSNMMYDILQGTYDAFLRDYAQTIRNFGHPVLFRFGNEMNGDWCPYSGYNTSKDTMIYKEAYRYIYKIFEAERVTNAIWVWNPNGDDFPNFRWNDALMYYPGDEYVDVVGLTAYNTGTYYANVGERWNTFSQLYDDLYEETCRLFRQPLMITEFGCANVGGDKESWVEDMFAQLDRFDRIKIAVWWDGVDYDAQGNIARSYVIDETEGLMDIFRRHLGGH